MPRVTQSHRDRQRARVLAAARQCFARRGFHATSMDQIIAEAGMSSSTVYRYFPEGKASLVRAVVDGWAGPLLEQLRLLSQADQPHSLEQVLVQGMQRLWMLKGIVAMGESDPQGGASRGASSVAPTDVSPTESPEPPESSESPDAVRAVTAHGSLVLEIWVECSRNPDLLVLGAQRYAQVRSMLVSLVRQWQDTGLVTDEIAASEAAAVIHTVFLGLIAESVIVGEARVEDAARALARLLTTKGSSER